MSAPEEVIREALNRARHHFEPGTDPLAALDSLIKERDGDKATLNAIAALLSLDEGQTGWDAIVSLQAERDRLLAGIGALVESLRHSHDIHRERFTAEKLADELEALTKTTEEP